MPPLFGRGIKQPLSKKLLNHQNTGRHSNKGADLKEELAQQAQRSQERDNERQGQQAAS